MFYGLDSDEQVEQMRVCLTTLIRIFGSVYASDDLIAIRRNVGFLSDPRLNRCISCALNYIEDVYLRNQAESKKWRLHTLVWAALSALPIPGSFVECGAFDGFSAHVAALYTDFAHIKKTYYLYDSFAGLSPESASSEEIKKNLFYERHPEAYEICRSRFTAFPNVKIVKGFVPKVLYAEAPDTVSLLHLDLNCALAELGVLEFFFDRLASGAIIVLDDYGKLVFDAQKRTADSFWNARGHSVLELPTGQGLVIKRLVS